MYPDKIDEFTEKLNKLDNNTYVIEEKVNVIDGVYQGELEHDNVSKSSLRIYTGPKLTGDKIENFILSTPSKTPWKLEIKIFSSISPVYITYETQGDTVEARDINKVQESIVNTEKTLNKEMDRAKDAEKNIANNLDSESTRATKSEEIISNNLNKEVTRATKSEKIISDNLNTEIDRSRKIEINITNNLNNEIKRSSSVEKGLNDNLNNEVNRAKQSEKTLNNSINTTNSNLNKEISRSTKEDEKLNTLISEESSRSKSSEKNIDTSLTNYKSSNNAEIQKLKEKDVYLNNRKSDKTYVDTELNKRYLKDQVFTKEEVLKKIQNVIGTAPEALDTLGEIAKALNSNKDFATTITNELSKKVDKIQGKNLSDENYTSAEKNKLAGIQDNANKYIHPSTHPATIISQNSSHRMVTDSEKSNWNSKAAANHTHDDRYYTEGECNNKFVTKGQLGDAGYGNMLKSVYDKNNNGKVDVSELADKTPWSGITGKPSTFPASKHNHDSSYMKKGKITWNNLKGV